ncbi:MAG: amidase [Chitinophagaceae bacterium]
MIRQKEISCIELLSTFYNQILKYNPTINAVTDIFPLDELLKEAKKKDELINNGIIEGLLHGIPLTVKDVFSVIGLKTTIGNPLMRKHIAQENAVLINSLKKAGAIIIGKTNLPLFSMDWKSENSWFGRTLNPYDVQRSPGGSSGGSAAALASGFTPLELGSDAGGSIRVPAHYCGICGLRTSEGLLSNDGNMEVPGRPHGLKYITVPGPMARNVKDLDIMLKVFLNKDIVNNDLADGTPSECKPLNIAYSLVLGGVQIDVEYKKVIKSFLEKLKKQGHNIVEEQPQYNSEKALLAWATILGLDFRMAMPSIPFRGIIAAAFIYFRFKNKIWAKGTYNGASGNKNSYAKALEYKDEVGSNYDEFFMKYDIWLTPVAPDCAFKHQRTGKHFFTNKKKVPYTHAIGSFTFTTALPGHPICVIPIDNIKNKMPVGIQIHAKKGSDENLLQIAQILEKSTEGFKRPSL